MLLIITTLSRCIALTDYEEGPLLSLDGALSFKAFVNKTDKHAPNHNLVVLTEEVQKGGQTYELETGASDTMKWAMGWYNDSTLLLQSSDIGNLIWQFTHGQLKSLATNQALDDFPEKLRAKKYKIKN